MTAPARHLCAFRGCREMTQHVLCWSHWRAAPLNVHRMSDEAVKTWAANGGGLPELRPSPAKPFNESAEKEA